MKLYLVKYFDRNDMLENQETCVMGEEALTVLLTVLLKNGYYILSIS